ncbi:SH3 domain-containing protein [Sporosarcina sp. 6E9]|uniref:SH3 domain-containing protein n=1 Tax=Sporosarcina sp. 6E9 TaxID=2819235 RepID=UPI001FF0CF50|nr:SH3 domain-containing protein [Sporosarcina sp. 6E9]
MSNVKKRIIVFVSFFMIILSLVLSPIGGSTAQASQILKGVALKSPTYVYDEAKPGSNVLKSYSEGSIMLYRAHNADWYTTSVTVKGKKHSGFISKADVDTSVETQTLLQGIGLQASTAVYATASTGSKKLKTYSVGSLLHYKTFTSEWYETSVIINGKRTPGYIHKSHVENGVESDEILKGLAILNPTAVYSRASTNSAALKSYSGGTILQYRNYTTDWYKATVYVGGKARTGFIHKSHVDATVDNQISLRGIGIQNKTSVYSSPSTGAPALKSYAEGTILQYKTLSSNWYEATVVISGKRVKGYIHTSHVEGIFDESESLEGIAVASPTNIYSRASKKSGVLQSSTKGTYVQFRTFSPNWYSTTVTVNGKSVTGYIHQKDVSTDRVITKTTQYDTDFNRAVDIQMGRAPQVSGKSGGWVNASRPQVEYYINASNFNINSADYYQFLVLSQPAALHAEEVNLKILNNHGTLTGKAQAFINAGTSYDVNEAYLISHALLETGNGSSDLAQGVPVDSKGKVVAPKDAVFMVYNMYGIGAVDSCPLDCGAKKAFDEGWFTPEEAIIGGAKFINTYIARGQDTLYKMRWNPINPGHPQYATDVAWALKQTSNIKRIYDLLDRYVLIYDVPQYVNQPAKSGDPDYYDGGTPNPGTTIDYPSEVYGLTETPNNLNLREGPSTGSKIVGSIPNASKIEMLGTNGIWYKVKYDGKTGWVHGSYVTMLNLLEVSTGSSTLAIRPDPNTSNTPIARVNSGTLLAGSLDKNNKLLRSNEWYQISYNGKKAWVSGGKNGTEFIKINN